jgi:glutamine synthetase
MSITNDHFEAEKAAYTTALLRSLHFSGVKFLRYMTVDICNNIRAKVKPVDYLLSSSPSVTLEAQVSVAEVCYGGLPYYGDNMIEGTGITAQNVLSINPDLASFRNLPYATKSAVVMGNLLDQYTNEASPFCCRSLLTKFLLDTAEKDNIAFVRCSLHAKNE